MYVPYWLREIKWFYFDLIWLLVFSERKYIEVKPETNPRFLATVQSEHWKHASELIYKRNVCGGGGGLQILKDAYLDPHTGQFVYK